MSEDTKMKQTTINISEKANLIWNIADIILAFSLNRSRFIQTS